MRKLLLITAVLVGLASAAQAETIVVTVNGLVCAFCATGIEKTFKKQASVKQVKVDLESKLVTVDTKPYQTLDDATVTKLLTDSGYTVTHIKRSGM